VLAFFAFSGDTLPQPPLTFNFTDNPFYTTVRVLSFDGQFPNMLVSLWNNTRNQAQAWAFIYFQIVYLYDMLFNVTGLRQPRQPAGRRAEHQQHLVCDLERSGSGGHVRDAYHARSVGWQAPHAELWVYLVANNYNVPDFNVDSIPAGWTPPS
jgi:hypothetical protein